MTATWAGLFATLLPLVADRRYGVGAGAIGLAMGAGYVADVVGLAAVGLVIDRVRQEPLFVGGAFTVAAGAILLVTGTSRPAFVIATVVIAAGFAVWVIPATILAARTGTPIPPGSLAGLRTSMDLGMIAGPLALGAIAELAGERAAAVAASLIFLAGALALARAGRRPTG